jgi:phage replication O-like protein O
LKRTGKPDNENGYTTIAHELLEVMALYPFTKSEYKVLLVIIRQTYGWKTKKKKLSYGIIAHATGMSRRQVKRSIDKLVEDNVLFKESNKSGSIFGLNKYYLTWKLWKSISTIDTDVHRLLPEVTTPEDKNVHTSIDSSVHTLASDEKKERNISKESIKERNNFSQSYFFKNTHQSFREHPEQAIHIKEVITAIT